MKYFSILFLLLLCHTWTHAQFDEKRLKEQPSKVTAAKSVFLDGKVAELSDVETPSTIDLQKRQLTMASLLSAKNRPKVRQLTEWGVPSWISGEVASFSRRTFDTPQEAAMAYMHEQEDILPIEDAIADLRAVTTNIDDESDMVHVKLQQVVHDIDVFGGEVWVHLKAGNPSSMTGRLYPSTMEKPTDYLSEADAFDIIKSHFDQLWQEVAPDIPGYEVKQYEAKMQWYPIEKTRIMKLAYVADVYPDFMHKHFIVIDALTGDVLNSYQNMCYFSPSVGAIRTGEHYDCSHEHETTEAPINAFMGDETASGLDLFGVNRNFNVILENGVYYMIDISRTHIYNPSASSLPSNPVGAIRTLDGLNNPFLGSINYAHVTSTNNTWNDRATVSAHYNSGKAYEYFLNTFNRLSINGQKGTITSFVHVTDENSNAMDNAFWNGEAMFYGDGNQAFFPLARGLDVAGHEISHGVVQNSANLNYENESGALNESFADIFGAMVDREDWLIGEDVVKTSQFPTGALRNMQDPTQGLSDGQNGYQPGHYNDRYTGSDDRGGVHINSGIANRAFYLFATAIGKTKAEQIYYHALTNYLTRSSNFLNCRAAVMQSALDRYGATERDAAALAFTQVGIGSGGGGGDIPTDNSTLPINPGDDRILVLNSADDEPWIIDPDVNILANPLVAQKPISKPSISDNGSRIVFINDQNNIYFVEIDWSIPQVTDSRALSTTGGWRNVAISKDGNLIAVTTQSPQNTITVFELSSGNGIEYPLTNPTTGGVATGDVLYSDAMEFDYSGRYILYDAVNQISGSNENIEYWDIGILRGWDRQANDFGDGQITKLFAGLPEGISIGNPTLSKTRPNVITFDLLEEGFFGVQNYLYASNIETNEVVEVLANSTICYPTYSNTDDRILYNSSNNTVRQILMLDDKISPNGYDMPFLSGAYWATWFGNGNRNVNVGTEDNVISEGYEISPNPTSTVLNVKLNNIAGTVQYVQIFDMQGQLIENKKIESRNEFKYHVKHLPTGNYILDIKTSTGVIREKIMIQH